MRCGSTALSEPTAADDLLRNAGVRLVLTAPENSCRADAPRHGDSCVDGLKEKTIRGGTARLSGQAGRSLIRLASIIVLARLLDPSEFGLVAMVTVLTGVFEIFST